MASILERQKRQLQRQRPLYERIQDWIFAWDIGTGVQFFRIGMFCLLVAGVVLVYTGTQFYGLRDPETMNHGQLARNLALGRGYVTRLIRPLDLYYLNAIGKPTLSPQRMMLPELWTPPGYPLVLSPLFRLTDGGKDGARVSMQRADRVMMLAGWFFFLTGLLITYLLARELFDRRVAALSAFLYLFCQALLADAVAGLPTGFVATLLLLAAYCLLKAERWQRAERSERWITAALLIGSLALAWAALTRYALMVVTVPWLIYVGVVFKTGRWRRLGLCALIFVLVLAPWFVRNRVVARDWKGLAPYGLLEEVGHGRYRVKEGDRQRLYGVESPWRLRSLALKVLENVREIYAGSIKEMGNNYLIVFFIASLLHRWREDEAVRLRRWLLWSLVVYGGWLSVAGQSQQNFFTVMVPLITIYGAAFFLVLFERLQFRTRLLRKGTIALFVALNLVLTVLAVLPPRKTVPYPPYNLGVGMELGRIFREDELLGSDIPWAVAWYADRSTLWMPKREKDFMEINDHVRVIAGVYLTQKTLEQESVLEEWLGEERFVLRLCQPPPPPGFPLQVYRPMTPDGEQVLLSNRSR